MSLISEDAAASEMAQDGGAFSGELVYYTVLVRAVGDLL